MPEATPTPQEKLDSLMNSLDFDLRSLQKDVQLASLRDGLEDLDTHINGLKARIRDLRGKGYVFGKSMEARAQEISRRWLPVRINVTKEISRQAPLLEQDLRPLETQYTQLKGRPAGLAIPAAERLQTAVNNLESKVSATTNTIRGMYDSFSNEVNAFRTDLDRVEWMLEQLSQASFQLLPTEGGIMAVKAVYSRDSKVEKEDPDGVLYLTDQRLIFEQKEEVATKKVLFIATEKKLVQQSLLEAPIALIDKVEASKKGLFGNEDHLAISFKSGAPVYQAWFHLNGQDSKWWNGLIGQARAGDFNDERAVEIDQQVVEKVRQAPTQCPNCGAPMNQVVMRGMDSIKCEYCQFVVRL